MNGDAAVWLTVFGPDLPEVDRRKGEYHVHVAGCDECRRYDPARSYSAAFVDRAQVAEVIVPDKLVEIGDYQAALAGFWFAPCCESLPEASALASAVEAVTRADAAVRPDLYYLTGDQARAIAELEEDVAVRGFKGGAEAAAVEVLIFLPSDDDADGRLFHETLLIGHDGKIVSRVKEEE